MEAATERCAEVVDHGESGITYIRIFFVVFGTDDGVLHIGFTDGTYELRGQRQHFDFDIDIIRTFGLQFQQLGPFPRLLRGPVKPVGIELDFNGSINKFGNGVFNFGLLTAKRLLATAEANDFF